MSYTLQQALEKLNKSQHKIAVYDILMETLEQFLDGDYEEAFKILELEDPSPVRIADSVFEEVYDELEELKAHTEKQLKEIMDLEVASVSAEEATDE